MPQPSKPNKVQWPQLCLSLFDLRSFGPAMRAKVAPMLDVSAACRPTDDPADAAVAFRCDLMLAAGAVDILRSEDRRAGDRITRAWVRRREGAAWERVPPDVVLTSLVGGKVVLGPWLGGAEAVPLVVGKVLLGRRE